MDLRFMLAALAIAALAGEAHADGNSLNIQQVPARSGPVAADGAVMQDEDSQQPPVDHQAEIINNPTISEFGRAAALTGGAVPAPGGANITDIRQDANKTVTEDQLSGGNVAIINQQGTNNSASVTQSGQYNTTVARQKGTKDKLWIDQKGLGNVAAGVQDGPYKHRVIRQNGQDVDVYDDGGAW